MITERTNKAHMCAVMDRYKIFFFSDMTRVFHGSGTQL